MSIHLSCAFMSSCQSPDDLTAIISGPSLDPKVTVSRPSIHIRRLPDGTDAWLEVIATATFSETDLVIDAIGACFKALSPGLKMGLDQIMVNGRVYSPLTLDSPLAISWRETRISALIGSLPSRGPRSIELSFATP